MPALSSPVAADSTSPASQDLVSVICAWPVSGQYGPGSRILYYVLVAACVLGRGSAWLRGACLAAALLLPAVAALHGIVLAAVHTDGAVDMDVYGAFQLCAIGVLAGPITVKLSRTYFNAPGRNLIFLWTTVILAGLLSLTVEFFRASPIGCPRDEFQLGVLGTCNITCDVDDPPYSPLRQDAQNNIYVIGSPHVFTFGTATLLCAACCIPPILSVVSMWNKILKQNWKKAFGRDDDSDMQDQYIPGTNSATPRRMVTVNQNITFYLKMVEIPIFGAAIVAILIVGELNFWSDDVNFQTEPIQSIGQWGPIVGTGLAAAGSLYALLAAGETEKDTASSASGEHHCTCRHHDNGLHDDADSTTSPVREMEERRTPDDLDVYPENVMLSPQNTYESSRSVRSPASNRLNGQGSLPSPGRAPSPLSNRSATSPISPRHLRQTSTNTMDGGPRGSRDLGRATTAGTSSTRETSSRHKVASIFGKIGEKLGTPAPGAFDDSEFQRGPASDYPELPGERERNSKLPKIMAAYNPARDSEGHATPLRRQRSHTGSFISVASAGLGDEGGSSEPPSPGAESAGPNASLLEKPHHRRATLEVPQRISLQVPNKRRSTFSSSISIPPGPASPTIQVSEHSENTAEQDTKDGAYTSKDEPDTPGTPGSAMGESK